MAVIFLVSVIRDFEGKEKHKKKEVSDFLVIGYLYSEKICNFIYVTSFFKIQLTSVL